MKIKYSSAFGGNKFKGVYVTIWASDDLKSFGYAKEGFCQPHELPFASAKDAEKAARRRIKVYGGTFGSLTAEQQTA